MGRGGSIVRSTVAIAAAIIGIGSIASGQLATPDRIQGPGWWPTKGTAPRADYVGSAACTPCHGSQASSQPLTSMARTAMKADQSDVLRGSPQLTFSSGDYAYRIASDDDRPASQPTGVRPQESQTGGQTPSRGGPLYTVSSGTRSSSVRLTWAFGAGKVGQSFLFDHDGTVHEARVSYFDSLHTLGFTPGRAVTAPRDLAEAMARPVDGAELRRCFACHTTAPTTEGKFDPSGAIPGVTCEACHGPGRRHVEAMTLPRNVGGDAPLLNPAKLRPEESVDFCGACHATFFDIALTGTQGTPALRSQPYRLQLSQCWKAGRDARLACIACHDPHRPLVTDPLAYDDRCLSCHLTAGAQPTGERGGRACPVGNSRCVTCHMPKYDVPDMHHQFTDHRIQVTPRSR
jgi:hypothetical protein